MSPGNWWEVKQTHKYYSQVQTQISITGSQFCDFVVWTEKDCAVVRVLMDADYWTTLLKRAQEFFHKVSLPELVSCYYTRQASTKTPVSTELQPCRTKRARTQAHDNIQNSGAFAKGLKTRMTALTDGITMTLHALSFFRCLVWNETGYSAPAPLCCIWRVSFTCSFDLSLVRWRR